MGARIEHQTTTPKSDQIKLAGISAPLPLPNALNYLTYSLAASLNYEILPQTSLYLNWQHAQRAPDVQELFASGPHFATRSFEIGRLNLNAEQTNHYELGLRLQAIRLHFMPMVITNRYKILSTWKTRVSFSISLLIHRVSNKLVQI